MSATLFSNFCSLIKVCGLGSRLPTEVHPVSGFLNKLCADSLSLVRSSDRQIREITDIVKIGKRSGHADQKLTLSRRHDRICMPDHIRHDLSVINGPPFAESGRVVKLDYPI
jgi:hypothetical protein